MTTPIKNLEQTTKTSHYFLTDDQFKDESKHISEMKRGREIFQFLTDNKLKTYVKDKLIDTIKNFNETEDYKKLNDEKLILRCKENIRSLMWYLDYKRIESDFDGYGYDKDSINNMQCWLDQKELLFEYIKVTAEQAGLLYKRTSSHYVGSVEGQQYGIDLDGLPGGMRTILFGRRKTIVKETDDTKKNEIDNTYWSTFIKMEEHGCPPLLVEKLPYIYVPSVTNIFENLGHLWFYLKSLARKKGLLKSITGARREKLSGDELKISKQQMALLKDMKIIVKNTEVKKYCFSEIFNVIEKVDYSKLIEDKTKEIENLQNDEKELRIVKHFKLKKLCKQLDLLKEGVEFADKLKVINDIDEKRGVLAVGRNWKEYAFSLDVESKKIGSERFDL